MGSTAKKPAADEMADLYERDFVLWTEEMARLLREHRFSELDIENLAEEVESMGRRDRREVASRLQVLLTHLIKWQIQPGHRSGSWQSTINVQRGRLSRVLEDSPSLRRTLVDELPNAYDLAREKAFAETGLRPALPNACPFTIEQILETGFLPK